MSAVRRPLSPATLGGALLVVAAVACGDVPTLADGVAYITPVILPSPALAVGDTLRDSTGRAAPLRLFAFDNDGDTVTGLAPAFLVSTPPAGSGVRITSAGFVIGDSLRSVQIVGQLGERLQTPPAQLEVVPQPDSLEATTTGRTITFPPFEVGTSLPVDVKVSSAAAGARAGVRSIIVRYQISRIVPATASFPDTLLVLLDDASRFIGPQGRTAVDTTDASGVASRRVRAVLSGFDSIEVTATATNLKGVPLRGSPRRFVLSKTLQSN